MITGWSALTPNALFESSHPLTTMWKSIGAGSGAGFRPTLKTQSDFGH